MAWTYSGDPSLSDLDMVRWHVGDTDVTKQEAQDEEIQASLDRYGSPERAGARVARSLSAKYARLFDKAAGDVRKSLSQISENYGRIADELEAVVAAASSGARKSEQLSNIYVW